MRIERGAAGGLPSLPNPAELVERFREGGLAALVQTARAARDRGTDAGGHGGHRGPRRARDGRARRPSLVPEHEGLRAAMAQPPPEPLGARADPRSGCSGMDMKMRQYELGKAFCDAVVASGGIESLNRVWDGPEALPTPVGARAAGRVARAHRGTRRIRFLSLVGARAIPSAALGPDGPGCN